MDCVLRQASDVTLGFLLQNPETIRSYLGFETPRRNQGLLSRIFGSKKPEHQRATIDIPDSSNGRVESIEKSWHGLHFLFTGSDWDSDLPNGFLLAGSVIGDVDVGYGPARAINVNETAAVCDFLKSIDHEFVSKNFDPQRMTELELYPNCWDREPEEELKYLLWNFDLLKAFVQETYDRNQGLVIYLG
jgi:hypothetical protein